MSASIVRLQFLYADANWKAVRAMFRSSALGDNLVQQMQRWKRENVQHLRVSLVYTRKVGSREYVGVLQFADDDRAVPQFRVYRFDTSRNPAEVAGAITGLGGPWIPTRTAHFVIYHGPYQLMGTDRRFITDLEAQRSIVANRFGVSLPPLTVIYLYPDGESMQKLSGGACGGSPGETGCTRPYLDPPLIETLINAIYHEPIHVYERALVPPVRGGTLFYAPLFLGEGTAVALENRHADARLSDYCSDLAYAPLDSCARLAIQSVDPLSILGDKGFNRTDPGYAYSLAGSFVKYLILKYGYRAFGHFYYKLAEQPADRESDYNIASRVVYGRPVRELLHAWRTQLCSTGC